MVSERLGCTRFREQVMSLGSQACHLGAKPRKTGPFLMPHTEFKPLAIGSMGSRLKCAPEKR